MFMRIGPGRSLPCWAWWLMVAMFVLGCEGCATKHPPVVPASYLILDDGMSSGVLVCVPLQIQTDQQHLSCVPIDFLRWFLRSQQKG